MLQSAPKQLLSDVVQPSERPPSSGTMAEGLERRFSSRMKTIPLLGDCLVLEPTVFGDARGFFFESFNQHRFEDAIGRRVTFVQDNHSRSAKNVLRGLHYQIKQPQGKLIRAVVGEIYDVAVDLRRSSPTFGRWAGVALSAENKRQVWVPEGFAHGFLVLSEHAEVLYKTSDYWAPEHERCVAWNDASLGIDWPMKGEPLLSSKDRQGCAFRAAELFD
jgi:dTDP-4-dehydrorhamnose 3,5-epimerase